MRNEASIIKGFRGSEGCGGDARRTSYTLPPESLADSERLGAIRGVVQHGRAYVRVHVGGDGDGRVTERG